MDDFDKILEEQIRKSAEIVALEDELRKLSNENKEDTSEFREKAKNLNGLLNSEYYFLDKLSDEDLDKFNEGIANKYKERDKKIRKNKTNDKDPFDGIDHNLREPLERLDIIIEDIIESKTEDYEQSISDEEEKDSEDDEYDEEDDEYDEEDDEYDEEDESLESPDTIKLLDKMAENLPKSSEKKGSLTDNYIDHRLIDAQENKYYKYMVIRSTIIAFQKLYSTIMLTPISTQEEQKYKNDLLEFLQEFKYIVFLKTPQLEKIAAKYNFDIYSIPIPPLPNEDITALIHNSCMTKITALYKTRIDTIDIETILERLKELLEIIEYIDYLDNQALGNLISFCEGNKEILGDNNFGTYAIKVLKKKIKENPPGKQKDNN